MTKGIKNFVVALHQVSTSKPVYMTWIYYCDSINSVIPDLQLILLGSELEIAVAWIPWRKLKEITTGMAPGLPVMRTDTSYLTSHLILKNASHPIEITSYN